MLFIFVLDDFGKILDQDIDIALILLPSLQIFCVASLAFQLSLFIVG
jgi:hypothetical protein